MSQEPKFKIPTEFIELPSKGLIINRQLCHFFRANVELGMRVASGLSVKIDDNVMKHTK